MVPTGDICKSYGGLVGFSLAGWVDGAKILKSENKQYSQYRAWEIPQPYQEIPTLGDVWATTFLTVLNNFICFLPLASLGLITQIYLYIYF